MPTFSRKILIPAASIGAAVAIGAALFIHHANHSLDVGSPNYQEFVDAFYSGVVALDVGDESHKDTLLKRATLAAPNEPAAWADLGLYYIRNSNLDQAASDLKTAADLAPNTPQIDMLQGLLAQRQGNYDGAVAAYKSAVSRAPDNLRDLYALLNADEQAGIGKQGELLSTAKTLADKAPDNLFVRLKLAQLEAQQGETAEVSKFLAYAQGISQNWSADPKSGLVELSKSLHSGNSRDSATSLLGLANQLINEPRYRADRSRIESSAERPGLPLERPIVIATPPSQPAPADMTTSFSGVQALSFGKQIRLVKQSVLVPQVPIEVSEKFQPVNLPARQESAAATLAVTGNSLVVTESPSKTVTLPFPSQSTDVLTSANIAVADINYDFLPDIAVAGSLGIRIYQQGANGQFKDIAQKTGLLPATLNKSYAGIWPADVDSDGDLDLIVAPNSGRPFVLRNNGDGTWTATDPFVGAPDNVVQCVWADINGDGAPDAVFLTRDGNVVPFMNMRAGQYAKSPPIPSVHVAAISAADYSHSGIDSLTVLQSDGEVDGFRYPTDQATTWSKTTVLTNSQPFTGTGVSMAWADLDNNGGLDLVISGSESSQVWLAQPNGIFSAIKAPIPANQLSLVGGEAGERLNLVGVDRSGQAVLCVNAGDLHYSYQNIHPRANFQERPAQGAPAAGQRINPFGIGGSVEVRAGLLYNKLNITDSAEHVGLGTYKTCNYIRIEWPNGDSQSQGEFDIASDQVYVAVQRLKASCPWLFAWDGSSMQLVTDCIWRSPLGLKINAQATAGIVQTTDWLKIRGDQLVPHDGYYDLRICAELWETHFFDHLALMTVDHPANTEIFVDERFSIPPPPLKVEPMSVVTPVAHATDENGTDVTALVARRDGKYVGTFGHGKYQGITKDHFLEVDLGDNAPKHGPLWLVANGWIHPTDSSINVAIGQGHTVVPKGLSLEVPDSKGKWSVARAGLGFPEGKIKTVLIDLTNVFKPNAPRRLRLRTNLEIYWDSVGYATGLPATPLRIGRPETLTADLHFRGFSVTHQADDSSPELPEYGKLISRGQRWRDLEGFYTRYGDVSPLLQKTDDRYVIMNAGDELALRFKEQLPPARGWVRDYVLVGDGWVKDGDFNTDFSRTVAPLPEHARANYNVAPTVIAVDPVYRKHKSDWTRFHTRYVDPSDFSNALVPQINL